MDGNPVTGCSNLASRGMCSQIRKPGTLVGMVPNAPRTSAGASGFGSQVSSWLCPPLVNTTNTDFARPKPGVDADGAPRLRPQLPSTAGMPTQSPSRRGRRAPQGFRGGCERGLVSGWFYDP